MTKLVFHDLTDLEQSLAALELIPDTHAWVKDTMGAFAFGNRLFYERFGVTSMQGLVGKTDYDLAPGYLADRYRADDDRVLTGGIVTDRLEIILGTDSSSEWFLTSKWPIYNHDGDVLGSFGISRHLNKAERKVVPYRELAAPIDYIGEHFADKLSISALAATCNLSVSALERRFKRHLGKTPNQYLNEVRLEHANRLLMETDKPIGIIAIETGFTDNSHFTRAFKGHYSCTPSQHRSPGEDEC